MPMIQATNSKSIVDDLAAHIALFHSSIRTASSNPNSRKAILRWFSSLSSQQRQACLTVFDADFVKILLQMVARLKTEGLCHFFILPDLPSSSGSSLPSLCHRQLDGLLSRASASNHSERLISRCVRLFGAECDLDSMSVSEDLVTDVEVFVEVMDEISNGQFLREADLRSSQSVWVELEWLKAKGYFSMESFISNRLELALRKSWLEHNGVKNPRSGKSRSKIASGGLGTNAFWRQKGCLDWWLGLDPGLRKKVYLEFLCKGSKQLGKEFIERRFSDLKNESAPYWIRSNPISSYISVSPLKRMSQLCCSLDPNFFFGSGSLSSSRKPSRLANQLNLLLVLQEVSEKFLPFSDTKCENESMFFSELESVSDVSCWILRKLGWSLMSVWKEYMKIELTNDLQFNKSKIRADEGFDKAKKKGINSKRMNSSKGSKFRENAPDKEKPKSRKSLQGNFASACSSSSFPQVVIKKESLEAQTELGSVVSKHMVTVKKPSSRRRRSRSKASNCVELHVTKDPEVKVIEVDANFSKQSHQLISLGDNPLEDEVLKQPISENSVSFSPVQSPCKYSQTFLELEADKLIKNRHHRVFPGKKDKSGKGSCYKDVRDDTTLFKREKFWSEDEFDQKNMKIFTDCASTHSQLDSPMAGLLHSDSSHMKQLSCCPLSLSHRGLDALKNKACSHQVVPPRVLPMSFDWPLMVRSLGSLNFDSLYNAASPSTLCSGMPNTYYQNDTEYSRDALDFCEFKSALEALDDSEGYWVSEDESNSHTWSGHDYNKLFGGGVMYWNTCDHAGTGFSHAPSQSSEDTLLAWHEAEMNQAVDDMVGNILPGNETSEELTAISEGPKGDLHSYPVLRPIVIPNISRKGSRSEFKINMEHSSPGVSSNRKNFPRVKRPLSPVILCVPRDSRPAIPYVGDSRKHRGFPVVRSGSSSPRSWGVRSCHQEEKASPRTCIRLNGNENGKHEGSPFMRSTSGPLVQERLIGVSHRDQEHPDVGIPIRSAEPCSSFDKERLSILHNLLHEEIDLFCKRVSAENLSRKSYINWAVMRVTKSLQVLWPRSRTSVFGSNATGLALPSSDVDLVVCLPPVRNLEPIKEAGILEGRNGIKETCLQHAARYLANQDWVKSDSLKTIENTAIPLIMLIAEVPCDINGNHQSHDSSDSKDSSLPNLDQPLSSRNAIAQSVRLDISFRSPTHTGLQTMELVRQLTEQFPASIPLALVLKQFLADRNLDRSYSGGLNSYCLVLLIIRFLQHEHHLFRSSNQNLGSLLMDFLYFFGNVFDPRQMHVSIQGSGIYLKRERVHCIDPIQIDDPLCPTNNVGKNCFRIHQCIKAFGDAYSTMDRQLASLATGSDSKYQAPFRLLREIIPGIECEYG